MDPSGGYELDSEAVELFLLPVDELESMSAEEDLARLVFPDEARVDAGLAALLSAANAAEAIAAIERDSESQERRRREDAAEVLLVRSLVSAACTAVLPVSAGSTIGRTAGNRAAHLHAAGADLAASADLAARAELAASSASPESSFAGVLVVSSGSVDRTMGAVFDDLAASDRAIGAATAVRVRLIDEVRVLSEIGVELGLSEADDPSQVRRWSSTAVARRALVSEVACTLRLPDRTAEALIEQSRALIHSLPVTFDALSQGTISYRHAEAIIDQVWSLPVDLLPVDAEVSADADAGAGAGADAGALSAEGVVASVESAVSVFERAAVPLAVGLTVAKFTRRVRILRERAHPESIDIRFSAVRGDRSVTLDPARDGMAWLSAYLPAVAAHGIYNRLTDIAITLKGGDETRTRAQLRADVLIDLLSYGTTEVDHADHPDHPDHADHAAPADPAGGVPASRRFPGPVGGGVRATVMITVPVLSLLGQEDTPASLEGYGPIELDTAKQLTAEAPSLIRLLTHPETGTILSVGRTRYSIPNDLRLWLRVRDVTCRYPGCSVSAVKCDLDHTLDWQHGGHTAHTNLASLCPAHHDLKHHTGWTLTQNHTGTLTWTSPTGHPFTNQPSNSL